MSSFARRLLITKAVGWREGTILVAVAWLVPFLVHLVPWGGARPLGVYLLPVFWTAFIAVYFYGALPGLAIGLVAPLANLVVTGLPAFRMAGFMGMEIVLFVAVAAPLVGRWPGFWFTAPLAWLGTKTLALALQFLIPAFGNTSNSVVHLGRSVQNGLAGLAVLAAINLLLVRLYPKTDDWERE